MPWFWLSYKITKNLWIGSSYHMYIDISWISDATILNPTTVCRLMDTNLLSYIAFWPSKTETLYSKKYQVCYLTLFCVNVILAIKDMQINTLQSAIVKPDFNGQLLFIHYLQFPLFSNNGVLSVKKIMTTVVLQNWS